VIVDNHQVAVWWGDDDPALLQFLIRDGHVDRQRVGALQDGWQCAGARRGNVQHYQDRGGQVWLECTYECNQALHATSRGPDNDNVAASNRI
jgi:myosin-crossreactive antigen